MALEVAEKFDHLRTLDAPGMDLEEEAPEGQSPDHRKAFLVERLLEHGRLPPWRPGACPSGPRAQAAFVDKDNQPVLAPRFFYARPPSLLPVPDGRFVPFHGPPFRALTTESR